MWRVSSGRDCRLLVIANCVQTSHWTIISTLSFLLREFKKWKVTRETELQKEENDKIQEEYETIKRKILSDIDTVKQKLKEERVDKKRQLSLDRDERIAAIKRKHDQEVARLRHQLQQATDETTVLRQKEKEESNVKRLSLSTPHTL